MKEKKSKPVLAPPILDRINPLLYSDNGSVQAIGAYFILQEVLARQSNKQFDVFSGKGSKSDTIKKFLVRQKIIYLVNFKFDSQPIV